MGLGVILKPVQFLRVGVAYQSPTWNSIDEDDSAYMNSKFIIPNESGFAEYDTPINTFSYRISSPQRLTGSLGFVLGNVGIISADVDWVNYAGMRIHGSNSYRKFFSEGLCWCLILVAFLVLRFPCGFRYCWYRDWETDRKSTRLNSSHRSLSRMPSSA